jgi:hypothetical protein
VPLSSLLDRKSVTRAGGGALSREAGEGRGGGFERSSNLFGPFNIPIGPPDGLFGPPEHLFGPSEDLVEPSEDLFGSSRTPSDHPRISSDRS